VTLIAGRYQPLDAARAGAPQRARDLHTAQTVWLRVVSLPKDAPDEALARAYAARGIFHPSLVTLFDVQPQPEARVLLAYEFVTAQSVAQASGGQPYNARRAAEILAEVADAAAELHARDIAHGAISQSSVLVTMKGKAKLDRVADPSLNTQRDPTIEDDLIALGTLLQELAARPTTSGVAGVQAIETVVGRAREGKLRSAATFAAMLRRI
jgi:serine/threonine protein kinase